MTWIAVIIVFHDDGTKTCRSFGNRYFWDDASSNYSGINYRHSCHMIRAAFAMANLRYFPLMIMLSQRCLLKGSSSLLAV
jgi:hypothetical protein